MLNKPFYKFSMMVLICIGMLVAVGPSSTLAQSVSGAKSTDSAKVTFIRLKIMELESKMEQVAKSKQDASQQWTDFLEKRRELLAKQDDLGISQESFGEIIRGLQSQRVELMIDLAGIEARRESMIEIRENTKTEQLDSLIEPLMQVLKLEQERLTYTEKLVKNSNLPRSELRNAQLKVLEVQIRLAQAKQPRQGDGLADELLAISLDRAEKQARLEKVETLLTSIVPSRKSLDQTMQLERQMGEAAERVKQANVSLSKLKSELDEFRLELDKSSQPSKKGEDQ